MLHLFYLFINISNSRQRKGNFLHFHIESIDFQKWTKIGLNWRENCVILLQIAPSTPSFDHLACFQSYLLHGSWKNMEGIFQLSRVNQSWSPNIHFPLNLVGFKKQIVAWDDKIPEVVEEIAYGTNVKLLVIYLASPYPANFTLISSKKRGIATRMHNSSIWKAIK